MDKGKPPAKTAENAQIAEMTEKVLKDGIWRVVNHFVESLRCLR